MKALVTGGAGFIGSHLVEELISKGISVHVMDNLSSGYLDYVHPQATLHCIDICSDEAKQLILNERPDIVFHLAAQADVGRSIQFPKHDADININGTINILEGCRDSSVKKIIFASTSAVYGKLQKDLISEKDMAVPISYYGLSKLTAEAYIRIFSQLFELPYTILRYGNVYGPRQTAKGEGGVVAVFLQRLRDSKPLKIHGDGEQTRDFIYVKDIVEANIAAMDRGDQETIQVSTAMNTSINQLVKLLEQINGNPIKTVHTSARPGDIKHSCLDNRKAATMLEWNPKIPILQGLRETVNYAFKNRGI